MNFTNSNDVAMNMLEVSKCLRNVLDNILELVSIFRPYVIILGVRVELFLKQKDYCSLILIYDACI